MVSGLHRNIFSPHLKCVLVFFSCLLISLFSTHSASAETVRDEFSTVSYSNNDGTQNWAADWVEVNDDNSPTFNFFRNIGISAGELRICRATGSDAYIYREADLSGAATATFSFDYRTSNNLEGSDRLLVEVSGDGGSTWTTLETFANDSSGHRDYDISAYISAAAQIRFYADSGLSVGEYFIFDNVQIDYVISAAGGATMRVWQESY